MNLLVVDGNSIVNRAFYGIKILTSKDGRYTNAIYGFLTMLEKIKETTNPDGVAIAFDVHAPTFRHKAYSGYKAQRKGMPPELAQQMPVLKELLKALGYRIVECEGYEADDILGTLSAVCEERGENCFLATGDRDSFQLISDTTKVYHTTTQAGKPAAKIYDNEEIFKEYGVTPKQLLDIKALQGDTSDNIPGVAGIGKKGAADLISKYGSIDYIYENIDTIDLKPSLRAKLEAGKDMAYLSRMLGEICRNAPIDTNISSYVVSQPDRMKAFKIMSDLQLISLMEKLGISVDEELSAISKEETKEKKAEELDYTYLLDKETALNKLTDDKKAFFTYTLDSYTVKEMFFVTDKEIFSVSPTDEFLKDFFENEEIYKFTHDFKPLFYIAEKKGLEVKGAEFDTALAGYLLDPSANSYELMRLYSEYSITFPPVKGDNIPEDVKHASSFKALAEKLESKLEENNQVSLLKDIEIPLAYVLAKMELTGFGVDAKGIEDYGKNLDSKINSIRNEIYECVGYEFNLNSPKQLGTALFEKLMLPVGKKTKSGYSTSAEVLEGLKDVHPAVAMILEYRGLAKLKSTYCDGLLKVIGEDGRIHSNFNQTETRTGRISSTEPNLQNIPVRTEQGKELRRFFRASESCVLVDADYSQIELRVLAHVANDKNMIDGFMAGEDIHTITASQVFGVPASMVTPLMRSRAKAVNFGIVYGIGAFSLAKDINVSIKEADRYIKAYLSHYAGVDSYMKNISEKAKQDGFVKTMFERRRYLPELQSSNKIQKAFGERVARNMPIQGTAADIIKIAMVRVDNRIQREGLKAKLILQVHDELIVEAPVSETDIVKKLLQEEMENAVQLNVPLVADASAGETWYEAKI